MTNEIKVEIAPADYEVTPMQRALWAALMGLCHGAFGHMPEEHVFSVLLSALSRELRRKAGPDGAAAALRALAEQQHEAAKFDTEEH